MTRKVSIEFLKQNLIAHRGVHNDYIVENTIQSFEKAIQMNLTIELDVQLTKDNEIIVFHDYNLKRLAGINKNIQSLTYEEIKKIKLKNMATIPTLTNVLNIVQGRVPIIIDIKDANKKLKQQIIELLDNYKGLFAIQSFNPITNYFFKSKRPKYVVGQILFSLINHKKSIKYKLLKYLIKPTFLCSNIKSTIDNNLDNIKKDFILIGWNVKKNQIKKYLNIYDNLIVDDIGS